MKTAAQLNREIGAALVPSIGKWHMHAGGAGDMDRHGYTFHLFEGSYHIDPVSSKFGRHLGYSLQFASRGSTPRGAHSGLWHDLGMHRSAVSAVKAAKQHYAKGFE